jgi:hypothetical protein
MENGMYRKGSNEIPTSNLQQVNINEEENLEYLTFTQILQKTGKSGCDVSRRDEEQIPAHSSPENHFWVR